MTAIITKQGQWSPHKGSSLLSSVGIFTKFGCYDKSILLCPPTNTILESASILPFSFSYYLLLLHLSILSLVILMIIYSTPPILMLSKGILRSTICNTCLYYYVIYLANFSCLLPIFCSCLIPIFRFQPFLLVS